MTSSLRFGLIALLVPSSLMAQSQLQISWGTSTVVDIITDSAGNAINLTDYSIELGGFANGFVPTGGNINDWLSNWQVFDAVTDPDTDSSDAFVAGVGTNARFVGSDFLDSNQVSLSEDSNGSDVFLAGSQAYVFVRNSDVVDDPTSEWLLYTSQEGEVWSFPSVEGSQLQFPLTWFLSEADEAIYGGINGEVGPGEFSDSATDFILRTHTFTSSVVPEPSAVFLTLGSLIFLMRRRR